MMKDSVLVIMSIISAFFCFFVNMMEEFVVHYYSYSTDFRGNEMKGDVMENFVSVIIYYLSSVLI